VPQGQLYYFHVTIYNAAAGEGSYSSTCPAGYTSNVAVIYNTNSTLANQIKTILTTNWQSTYTAVTGTLPTWSVTVIPQSFIPTTYTAGVTVLNGDPIIVTPDTSIYSNPVLTHNVTGGGKGIIGMGGGGTRMIDTVSDYFVSWSYGGTRPVEIGWGASAVNSTPSIWAYTLSLNNESVWSSPLTCPSAITGFPAHVQMAYTAATSVVVYKSAWNVNPANGYLYAQMDGSTTYFPVARQDRFLQWGFEGLMDRPFTGWVLFVNLVNRMSLF
jgi:hypothetical protein